MLKPLTPTKMTAKAESCAGPLASSNGIVTVKFWYGGSPGVDAKNCGSKGPSKSKVPNSSPGVGQGSLLHDAIPIATATLTTLVKESYKINVSTVGWSISSIKTYSLVNLYYDAGAWGDSGTIGGRADVNTLRKASGS